MHGGESEYEVNVYLPFHAAFFNKTWVWYVGKRAQWTGASGGMDLARGKVTLFMIKRMFCDFCSSLI